MQWFTFISCKVQRKWSNETNTSIAFSILRKFNQIWFEILTSWYVLLGVMLHCVGNWLWVYNYENKRHAVFRANGQGSRVWRKYLFWDTLKHPWKCKMYIMTTLNVCPSSLKKLLSGLFCLRLFSRATLNRTSALHFPSKYLKLSQNISKFLKISENIFEHHPYNILSKQGTSWKVFFLSILRLHDVPLLKTVRRCRCQNWKGDV